MAIKDTVSIINEIYPYPERVTDYKYTEEKQRFRRVSFEIRHGDITFDKLDQLSKAFKTKLINLYPKSFDAGGCPTCGDGIESFVEIEILIKLES